MAWDDVLFYAELLELPTVPVLEMGLFTESEIKQFVAKNKVPLLFGTVTMRSEEQFYNSAILLSAKC